MKTWQICLLALLSITAVCEGEPPVTEPPVTEPHVTEPPAPGPSPPTDLEVAHISSTSLFLRWKWPSDNAVLSTAKFEVTATPKGGADAKPVSVEGKLYLVLDGLTPATDYVITVASVSADGKETSESDPRDIETLKGDFTKPTVTVEATGGREDPDTISYKTSWTFEDPSAKDFTGFEVLYCTSSCVAQVVEKDKELSSVEDLDYFTDYTVIVSAVFKMDDEKERKQASAPSYFKTVTGKPGRVENIAFYQKPDAFEIVVSWSPPNEPNGEIQSYEVELAVAENEIVRASPTKPKYTYSITKRDDVSSKNEVKVRAVNNKDFKDGVLVVKSYTPEKPEPPASVNLTSRTAESLEILIERESEAELTFEIKYQSNGTIVTKNRTVVLKGFEAFEEVPLEVAVCVPLEGEAICGSPFETSFKTNVAAPSEVRNVTLETADDKVNLTWVQPEQPAGPIDGYIVRISDETNGVTTDVDTGKDLEYSFEEVKNCTKYNFAVMAFNNDLTTQQKVNGTLSTAVVFTSENCDGSEGSKSFPAWAIVLIVLIILGAAGGGAFYFVKKRSGSY